MIGIYGIHNKINNKIYVGQTIDIDIRHREHYQQLRSGTHANQHLQNAWNKYGEKSFEFIVLEECILRNLTSREQWWIDYYGGIDSKNTYNIREAGSKGRLADETKQKLSKAHKGKKLSKETCQKISNAQKGICRIVTDEQKQRHRQAVIRGCNAESEINRRKLSAKKQWQDPKFRSKMTNLWKGKHHTDVTKEKQRNIAKARCATEEFKKVLARSNAKAVCQFDKNDSLLAIYPSVLEASRVTGTTSGSIYYSCSNPNSESKTGYKWRYKKDVKDI